VAVARLDQELVGSAPAQLALTIRSWLREAWHAPERLLHPLRRVLARRSLRRRSTPNAVLFLCHGNVCRSPYAAMRFTRALPTALRSTIRAASAGFIGPDRPSPELALNAARRRDIDMSAHRSALVTPEAVRENDLVVVMSAEQARAVASRFGDRHALVLGDLDPRSIRRRTVLDPWDGDASAFDESYERIDRCISELVRLLEVHG
jgi:protein-tyrosine phosphatase